MSIFARLFAATEPPQQSARPMKGTTPASPLPTPSVATATYPELAAAMDRIADLREQAGRDIEAASIARRNAILATDDAAVAAAEAKTDAAHRLTEALDLAEPDIAARMREIAAERRRAEFTALAADAIPVGRTLVAALQDAAKALVAVQGIRGQLARVGTAAEVEVVMPVPPLADFEGFAARYAAALDRASGIVPPEEAARRATTFAVRILRHYSVPGFFDALMPGEMRGYAAEDAWRFVAAGVAAWADEHRIPAMPAVSPLPNALLAKVAPPPPDDRGTIAVRFLRLGFAAPGLADADLAPGATLRLPALYATAAVVGEWAEFKPIPTLAAEGANDA